MDKQKGSNSWLVILVFTLLIGIAIWSVVLMKDGQASQTLKTQPPQTDVSSTNSEIPSITKSNTLIVGGDDGNPPYSYLENGEAKGLDNDLMREVAKNLGMNVEFILAPIEKTKQNLKDGTIDVIGGLAISEILKNDFYFGTSHAFQTFDLFVRRDVKIQSLDDMLERVVIVQKADLMKEFLTDSGYQGRIVVTEDPVEALTWVAAGRYDGVILNRIQGYYTVKEYKFANIKGLGLEINGVDYGFAVKKSNWNLLLKINQSVAITQVSGVYEQLANKWLFPHQRTSFFDRNEYYIYGFVVLLAAVLLVLIWGWSLNQQVKRKTKELSESEGKYRLLINNATEGVAILVDKKIVYLNPYAASLLTNKPETPEALPSLIDIIHPDDRDIVMTQYFNLINNVPSDAQLSFRLITLEGVVKWIRSSTVRIEWEGKPALLSFVFDFTEERQLQESLRASEERYRLVYAQSPIGMFQYNSDLKITSVNDRFAEIMQTSPEFLEGFDLTDVKDQKILKVLKTAINHETGIYEGKFKTWIVPGQKELFVKLRTTPLLNARLENQGGIGLVEDITEQRMREHKILHLEERFSKAFLTSPDAININRLRDGLFIDINRGFTDLTGYSREDVLGKTSIEIDLWVNKADRDRLVQGLIDKGEYKNLETQFRFKDGQIKTGLMSASIIEIDDEKCILSITRDIDDLRKASQLIEESERRYRTIFESVPVSIWEQDFVAVYDMLEELRRKGVSDLATYMTEHPSFVKKAVASVKALSVNDASVKIFKGKSKDDLILSLDKILTKDAVKKFQDELLAIWNRQSFFECDTENINLAGEKILVNIMMRIPNTREGFKNMLISLTDITQRKQAEKELEMSEARYRQLIEQINVVVYQDHFGVPSKPKYISPQVTALLGYTPEEWISDPNLYYKVVHPEDMKAFLDLDVQTDKTGDPFVIEYRANTRDGKIIWLHDEAVLVFDQNGKPESWHGVMYDITDRKNAEEALRESEKRYRTIFASVPVSIKEEDYSQIFIMFEELRAKGITDFEDHANRNPEWLRKAMESIKVNEVNEETLKIYKAESKDQLLKPLTVFLPEESMESFKKELQAFWDHASSYQRETVNTTLTGETIDVWISISIPTETQDYSRVLVTVMDISERKRAEEQIRLQIRYLAALRAVDMAISASMDLPITLRVLLNQVNLQLGVEATSILLLDPHTQTLKYSAGLGFQTPAIETTALRLGQSYAGQAALERRIIMAEDLNTKASRILTPEFSQENFSHYIGVPLVSKGVVKGVLELFNRTPFKQDPAWFGLLESMAGQAAIAIENAMLLDEVQKVNINLRSAYDATIEGWARSLSLREGDAQGHVKQVADLTVELAQTAGYQGEGLLSIRRGALLHDIGKLAIPDTILFKPAPLTDDEWKIMKTHPVVSKRILNSIDFLQPAIDIPYSHHEKWDGTGYPDGLKGTQIPFAARVFAIVDCWDSLRSNRPWRKAWTDEQAWDYIINNSGKAFDPQIVEKFRQLLGHGFSSFF
jgi:PAS domain S-box-containing protein